MADQLATEIIATIKNRVESESGEGKSVSIIGEITTATELTSLGVDSLGPVEQAYGIKIDMNSADAWSNLKNVGDMVEAVRVLLAKEV
ncbi:nodulation protein NodF [Mesorhizobium loti]|uniref:Acyl carrier protein n=1 Tax=Mesorhizobium erdmanii TaxID=1777866 RepID=A0A6M7UMT6_9HYPH|nr:MULTISPECIES: acyl carrier protein [Mesorhizobium]OBP75050.1 nodulation protein NodF [Mesorhizobium loti]OBQ68020.1 nodulation protein NodF [Mesorhizobium loti]QKC79369.1 acyl carrier protein [Mesorhizobium erdmanii]